MLLVTSVSFCPSLEMYLKKAELATHFKLLIFTYLINLIILGMLISQFDTFLFIGLKRTSFWLVMHFWLVIFSSHFISLLSKSCDYTTDLFI